VKGCFDDVDSAEAGAREANAAPQLMAISAVPSGSAPAPTTASSCGRKTFSARDAAILIVGASGGHRRVQAASL
jgi:hypothetical protein